MSEKLKVLITGASGLIGGLVWRNLGDKYEFSGLNRSSVDGIPNTEADIRDLDAIMPAFEGIDMVLHLANHTTDVVDWEKHFNVGMLGTRNVYEASRINGIKRVVLGSTGRNFAAGMSGGVAFVLDENGEFDRHCNPEMVSLETVTKEEDARNLRGLIEEHLFFTGSTVAAQVLEKWDQILPKFVMVIPVAYKKMLQGNRTAMGQQIGSVARG